MGLSTAEIPILWSALNLSKVLWSYFGGDLADRVPRARLVAMGWLVYAIVYLGLGAATATWHVWALFVVYGVFYGLTEPVEKALVSDLVASVRSRPGVRRVQLRRRHHVAPGGPTHRGSVARLGAGGRARDRRGARRGGVLRAAGLGCHGGRVSSQSAASGPGQPRAKRRKAPAVVSRDRDAPLQGLMPPIGWSIDRVIGHLSRGLHFAAQSSTR